MDPTDIGALIDSRPLSPFQVRVLVLIGCLVLMDGFDVQVIGFVAPALLRTWSLAPDALGPIFGAGLLGMLVGSTGLGMLADRIGRRPVLIGATFFVALCVLSTAATRSVPQMLALRFLTGLGLGGALGNAITLASEYCPSARRASLLMGISCGFTAGAILGGLLAAILIPRAGWRAVFVAGGLLPLGVAILLIRELPESLQLLLVRGADRARIQYWLQRLAPGIIFEPTTTHQITDVAVKTSVIDLFRGGLSVRSLLLWAVSFANLLNLFFLANWLPTLATRMGYSDSQGVLMGTTLQAGGILGALILGRFIDRFGFYRVLVPSFLLGAVMIAGVGRPDLPVAAACAVVLLAGATIVGGQPGINALATFVYPTQLRATGVGWCLGIGRAGSIVGPMAAAQLIAHHFTNESLFMFAAIPAVFSSLMIAGLAKTPPRRDRPLLRR
ncbi:MAG TPA: MFS transporter [Steroidobacteraceae bacterium]|nr:MFS transporter [Steroidobacteraceae bacterium]